MQHAKFMVNIYITLQWKVWVNMYTALRIDSLWRWLLTNTDTESTLTIWLGKILCFWTTSYTSHFSHCKGSQRRKILVPSAKSWTPTHTQKRVMVEVFFTIRQTVTLIYYNREVICHSWINSDFMFSQGTFALIIQFVSHFCTVFKIYSLLSQSAVNYSFALLFGIFYHLDIIDDSIKSHGPLHKKKRLGHADFHILILPVHLLKVVSRKIICL